MSKEKNSNNAYARTLRSRYYVIILSIILLATSAACLSQGTNARQEVSKGVAPQTLNATVRQPLPQPTRFEYVQLFSRNNWVVAESNRVLRTADSGRTWIQIFSIEPPSNDNNQIQGFSFVDERVGFLIVGDHLHFTDDSGAKWVDKGAIDSGAEKVSFANCYFLDAMHGWAVGMAWQEGWVNDPKIPRYVGAAFATQDGGRTWQRQVLNLPKGHLPDGAPWKLNNVLFKDSKTGWLVGDRGIIFRTEGINGIWHMATAEDVDYQYINVLDDQFGWATYKYGNSSWGLAITTNGGRQWKLLKESFVYGTWPVFAVFLTPEHGFAVSLKLYETRDSGGHWKVRSGSDKADDQAYEYLGQARDGTLVVLGSKNGTLTTLISSDRGSTWQLTK